MVIQIFVAQTGYFIYDCSEEQIKSLWPNLASFRDVRLMSPSNLSLHLNQRFLGVAAPESPDSAKLEKNKIRSLCVER